ncbi:FUS-interacting serine-arginine-rich protein, putative [Perkinsus marinus ATCC 50983]|uniref:FUS-interacting serine-arginine-rich protein, putative n=1 Tax=Perkinsus marinus (strain ATCC 50983 / TXsc) TaxID=423536 RepID=C5KS29_PERM5|nr:FUS-interacting serine-arginine-rich protein, putative [Perkinsus marinus ATCC 50983]EER12720.1 FUS-interacting serine-arginine-rich protein, putative [Perkinsus marinus ATCC 50983]|eukprot:XP_002780925.1 FUS-interacting serine-arginine-rich protein, putative [Perkinsus marinus ATCC 50983]
MMLREAFEKYGEIRDVYIPLDYYSRRPRGFGFVEFSDPRDADEAKAAMDGKRIGGNAIEVEIAKERRKSPKTMRRMDDDYRGHRGGYGGGGGGYRDDYYRGGGGGYRERSYRGRGRSRSRSYDNDRRSRSRGRGGKY